MFQESKAVADTFNSFKLQEVIGDRPERKQLALLGKFDGSEDDAIVIVTQGHLNKDKAAEIVSSAEDFQLQFQNSVYSKFDIKPRQELLSTTIDLVYPATEQHIHKHRDQEYVMIRESPLDYVKCTLPFIKSIPESQIQWVYNALEGKAESERILFESNDPETGFIMFPDMKWDSKIVEYLYYISICKRRDIRSLRDLDASHIPLLESIRDNGCEAISKKHNVRKEKLRVFVHYPPSYFHFHVHFAHLNVQGPGMFAGKAHLLDDIIDNISGKPDFYKQASLSFTLGEDTLHYNYFKEQM